MSNFRPSLDPNSVVMQVQQSVRSFARRAIRQRLSHRCWSRAVRPLAAGAPPQRAISLPVSRAPAAFAQALSQRVVLCRPRLSVLSRAVRPSAAGAPPQRAASLCTSSVHWSSPSGASSTSNAMLSSLCAFLTGVASAKPQPCAVSRITCRPEVFPCRVRLYSCTLAATKYEALPHPSTGGATATSRGAPSSNFRPNPSIKRTCLRQAAYLQRWANAQVGPHA